MHSTSSFMATFAPASVDCQILQFKQLCKLKTCPDRSKRVYQNPTQLIATSSLYGLTFVGERSGLKIIVSSKIFENNLGGLNPKNVVNNYLHRNITLPSAPSHIDINSDQQFLSVAFCKNETPFLRVYEIRTLLEHTPVVLSEVRLSPASNAYVTDLSWNPAIINMLTCCISDRTLSVYTFNSNGSFEVKSLPKESNSLCVCWSPKGKQLVVGNDNGYLTQYLPELKAMKNYPPPSNIFDKPCSLCSIKWLSNFQFIGVYKLQTPNEEDGDSKTSVIIINTSKNEPVTYINYEDICFSSGTERPCQFYFIHVAPWNMIFAASSNAVEVSVLKQQHDSVSWCHWVLEDSVRITLPMSGVNETFPVGIAVDYSSPIQSPIGDNFMPMPIISVLTCEGLLCLYVVNYMDPNAPNICVKPQFEPPLQYFTNDDVTNEDEVVPPQRTVPVPNSTAFSPSQAPLISSEPVAATLSKPVDIGNIVSAATTNLQPPVDTLSRLVQQGLPPSNYIPSNQNTVSNSSVTVNQTLKEMGQKTKITYASTCVADESASATKSDLQAKARQECMKKFKKVASTFESDISEIKELVDNICIENDGNVLFNERLTKLKIDMTRLMKLKSVLSNEIDSIQISLVEVFACIQDIKTKYVQLTNPSYRTLLGAQDMDPVNATNLKNIENIINYVDSQLKKANQQLDELWCKYNEHSSPTRMKIPILDSVYETMMRQQKILRILELQSEKIQKQIAAVKCQAKSNQWMKSKRDLNVFASRAFDDITLAEFTQKALTIKGDYCDDLASNDAKTLARKFSLEHARRFHISNSKLLKLQELHSGISVTYIQSSRLQRLKKKSLILLSKSAYAKESTAEDDGDVVACIPTEPARQNVEESHLRLSPVSSEGDNIPDQSSVLGYPNGQSIISSTPVKSFDKYVAPRFPVEPSINVEVSFPRTASSKTTSPVPAPKTESDRFFASATITLSTQSKPKDNQPPISSPLAPFSSNVAAVTALTTSDPKASVTTLAASKDSPLSFFKNFTTSTSTENTVPMSLPSGEVTITPIGKAGAGVTTSNTSSQMPSLFAKNLPAISTPISTTGSSFFGGLLNTSTSAVSIPSTFFSNAPTPSAPAATATSSAPVSIFSGNKLGSSSGSLFHSAGLVTSSSNLPAVSSTVKVGPFSSSSGLNVGASNITNGSNITSMSAASLAKPNITATPSSSSVPISVASTGASTIFGGTGSMFGKGSSLAASSVNFGSVLPSSTPLFGTSSQQTTTDLTTSTDKKTSAFSSFNFASKLPTNSSVTVTELSANNSQSEASDVNKENETATISAITTLGGTTSIGSAAQTFSFASINTATFAPTKTNLFSAPPSSSAELAVPSFASTASAPTSGTASVTTSSDSQSLLSSILSSKPPSSGTTGSISGGNLFQAVPAISEASLPTAAATSPTAVLVTPTITPAPAVVAPVIEPVTPAPSPPAATPISTSVETGVTSPAMASGSFFEGLSLGATTTTSAQSSSIFGKPSTGSSSVFGGNLFGQSSSQGTATGETKSIFGGSSLFGGSNATNTENQNLFNTTGSVPFSENQTSVFGGSSVFGSASAFGNTNVNAAPQPANAFGASSGGMLFSGGVGSGFTSPTNSLFQNNTAGFGSPSSFGGNMPQTQTAGGFGSPPSFSNTFNKSSFASFGGAATFGGAPAFGGSPTKVFGQGAQNQGAFGATATHQTTAFENLATENTMTFGNLAQQQTPGFGSPPSFGATNRQPSFGQSNFGGSSFSSWR